MSRNLSSTVLASSGFRIPVTSNPIEFDKMARDSFAMSTSLEIRCDRRDRQFFAVSSLVLLTTHLSHARKCVRVDLRRFDTFDLDQAGSTVAAPIGCSSKQDRIAWNLASLAHDSEGGRLDQAGQMRVLPPGRIPYPHLCHTGPLESLVWRMRSELRAVCECICGTCRRGMPTAVLAEQGHPKTKIDASVVGLSATQDRLS